jgi:hypothetical protein
MKCSEIPMKAGGFEAKNPEKWTWDGYDIGGAVVHLSLNHSGGDETFTTFHLTEEWSRKDYQVKFEYGAPTCGEPMAYDSSKEAEWWSSDFATILMKINGNRWDDRSTTDHVIWVYNNWAALKAAGKAFWDDAQAAAS